MRKTLGNLFGALRSSYWFIPTLMTFLSAVLALVMVRLDQSLQLTTFRELGFIYFNQPDGARALVATIASSMITVAGTTFSITLAVLSLTSGQFGSRLLNNFMRDLGNQVVLGTFVSTFVYCLLILRTIHSDDTVSGEAFVPHLAVILAIFFALSSLGVFIYFIHHTASSIQASTITARIARDLEKFIAKYPERGRAAPLPLPEGDGTLIFGKGSGYLQNVDEGALAAAAEKQGVVLEVLPALGTFLLPGQPLLRVFGARGADLGRLERHFTLGARRDAGHDIDFLFAQLTEMALRALSPSVNDAVTAMRCADRVAQGILLLDGRDLSGQRQRGGALRLLLPELEPAAIARFSFGETRRFSADNLLYSQHLLATIGKLLALTKGERLRRTLLREAELLLEGAQDQLLPDDFKRLEACYRESVTFSRAARGAPTLRA